MTIDAGGRSGDDSLESLISEAQAAVSSSANTLRVVRDRYRHAHVQRLERWDQLRERAADVGPRRRGARGSAAAGAVARAGGPPAGSGAAEGDSDPSTGSKTATKGRRARPARNGAGRDGTVSAHRDEALAGGEVGLERAALGRIELAIRSLENAWLFLGRDDATLVMDPAGPASAEDAQMRIVEAQEAERSRLAREVHDGPAQALANAVFQVEVVERLLDRDEALARAELQLLREILIRELRSVRAYLSQLRPPLLADLGLSGAIREATEQVASVAGATPTVELDDGLDALPETIEIVILRVVQEALQNVRKHAGASSIRVRVSRDDGAWSVEVRDDGRGFDPEAVQVVGRRNFGLQFMRERAELIGARFEVRSRPGLGTVVRMAIPSGAEEST